MSEIAHHIEPLFSAEEIDIQVGLFADRIVADFPNQPITLLGILSGATPLTVDLGRKLWEKGKHDVSLEFMGVESYGDGTTSSAAPKITKDTKTPIAEKNVIVVEDIVDTGYSIEALLKILESRGALTLSVLALLSKADRREVNVPINYLGFSIPDKFVVGYGLDWNENYRTMPDIGVVVFD
ncbi:MAG: hypoxanthine phosphoribosyltransferase [bacterium]